MQSNFKCQNNETQLVLDYFAKRHGPEFKGNVLEIGANDGVTFSNSFDLIELGWSAWLVEPSSVFSSLADLHSDSENIHCLNVAIGSDRGKMTLFESGAHVTGGRDSALVSTFIPAEMQRWNGVDFKPVSVDVITFDDLYSNAGQPIMHYISLDVEGMEWDILKQIDLNAVGCEALCIEWNGRSVIGRMFSNYCAKFGLREIARNGENLIFARH